MEITQMDQENKTWKVKSWHGYPEYSAKHYLQPGVNNQTRTVTAPKSRYYFHTRIHWKDGPLFN